MGQNQNPKNCNLAEDKYWNQALSLWLSMAVCGSRGPTTMRRDIPHLSFFVAFRFLLRFCSHWVHVLELSLEFSSIFAARDGERMLGILRWWGEVAFLMEFGGLLIFGGERYDFPVCYAWIFIFFNWIFKVIWSQSCTFGWFLLLWWNSRCEFFLSNFKMSWFCLRWNGFLWFLSKDWILMND